MKIAGRYTLIDEIGRGGMGGVWRAHDEDVQRDVALKVIGFAPHQSTKNQRDRTLAAQVEHPHAVTVYDVVDEGIDRWLVTEYVRGESLATVVNRTGPLDVEHVATLFSQAADALAYAHRTGVVHKNLKPTNMVVADGQVKITDFDVARFDDDRSVVNSEYAEVSRGYLAPEVVAGRPATERSDVWSLGAMMLFALHGRSPREAGRPELGNELAHDQPLGPVLAGALAPDPAYRWSMAELHEYLRGSFDAGSAPAVNPGTEGRNTGVGAAKKKLIGVRAASVAVVVIALVAAGAIAVAGGPDEPSETSAAATSQSVVDRPPAPSETATPTPTADPADTMGTFVQDYLDAVVKDPSAGWAMLTPHFQRTQSGGFDQYRQWWAQFKSAKIRVKKADPDTGLIRYAVTYRMQNGQAVEDSVELELTRKGDSYLIDREVGLR